MNTRFAERITFTPEAVEFIREKGGIVTLRSTVKHGCCGGRVDLVIAEAESLVDSAQFDRFEIDDVTLMVEPGLADHLRQPIRIGLDSFFAFRSLYVEGAAARM